MGAAPPPEQLTNSQTSHYSSNNASSSSATYLSRQSANKGLPLGSVKYHLSSIGGVEESRIEIVLDSISPSSFGAASRSLPAMDVWVEVIDSSSREGGWHAVDMSKPAYTQRCDTEQC